MVVELRLRLLLCVVVVARVLERLHVVRMVVGVPRVEGGIVDQLCVG